MYQKYRVYVSKIESVYERARRGFFRAENSAPRFFRSQNTNFEDFEGTVRSLATMPQLKSLYISLQEEGEGRRKKKKDC